MTKFNARKKLLLAILIIVMAVTALVGAISLSMIPDSYASGNAETTNSEQYNIHNIAYLTEEDYPSTNLEIVDGMVTEKYANDYYGKNAKSNLSFIQVLDNDPIIKVIPERLFREIGVTQHMGKEFGFFIETWEPENDIDALVSTVILIKIDIKDDMLDTKSHLKIKITPIFQGDFTYVKPNATKMYGIGEQNKNFFQNKYSYDTNVVLPNAEEGYLVPLATQTSSLKGEFLQHNKYYLTDVSNQTSLYNVNQSNPYDFDYVPQDDMGCFFSQTDFAYDGVFAKKGSASLSEIGSVTFGAASTAFDIYDKTVGLKSVLKAVPVIGDIVTVADLFVTMGKINDSFKYKEISESKKLTYTPFYNNKEQQIAKGGLHKDEVIAVTGSEDRLLFGTGNYFEFDYQINCQDIRVDTRFATMLNIGVISVVNEYGSTQFGDVNYSTSSFCGDLYNYTSEGYKEIPELAIDQHDVTQKLNFLPNYEKYIELNAPLTDKYTISMEYNPYAKFRVYEVPKINGKIDHLDKSKLLLDSTSINGCAQGVIELDADKAYMLIADLRNQYDNDTIKGRYGDTNLNIRFTPDKLELQDNEIQFDYNKTYFEFEAAQNLYYRFTLDNSNSNLSMQIYNSNFEPINSVQSSEMLSVLEKGKYFIMVDKSDTGATSASLYIRDEMIINFNNIDGINNNIESQIIITSSENSDNINLPTPVKLGFIFEGWWTSLHSIGEIVSDDNIKSMMTKPILELYAKLTPIKYTISYIENGGNTIADTEYTAEHNVTLNTNILRDNFVFIGWYDNAEFIGDKVTHIDEGSIGNRVFYAKWVKEKLTISFDINISATDDIAADFDNQNFIVNYGSKYTLPTPSHVGFKFVGWSPDKINLYTDGFGVSKSNFYDEQDMLFYAVWERNAFYLEVSVDGGLKWVNMDGDDIIISNDKPDNANFEYKANALCPNCYVLQLRDVEQWQDSALFDGIYKQGHIFYAFLSSNNGIFCWNSLSAEQIKGNTIKLNLKYNIESNFEINVIDDGKEIQSIKKNYNEKFELNKPQKTGYTFSHFIVKNSDNNKIYQNTLFAPGNKFAYNYMPDLSIGYEANNMVLELEPVFIGKAYTVSFGNVVNSLPQKKVVFGDPYNNSNNNAFPIPAKGGYNFEGWVYDGKIIVNSNGSINKWSIPNNCTLTAKWSPKEYRLTFDFQGGNSGTTNIITEFDDELPKATAPVKTGYTFQGYYSKPNGSGDKYYNSDMSSAIIWKLLENSTVYAHWTATDYTVRLDMQGGSDGTTSIKVAFDSEMTSAVKPSRYGYQFGGYYSEPNGHGNRYYDSLMTSVRAWDIAKDTILYAKWTPKVHDLKVLYTDDAFTPVINQLSKGQEYKLIYNIDVRIVAPIIEGYTFDYWILKKSSPKLEAGYEKLDSSTVIFFNYMKFIESKDGFKNLNLLAIYKSSSSCVAEGTFVTLADGSQKPVEELNGDEMLLAWNMKTGFYDVAPILFIDSDPARMYEIIKLTFSDGTNVKVISEHAFWDFDLNRYVYLRNDAAQYIGHWFNKQNTDGNGLMTWTKVQLTSVNLSQEYTTAWSPVTYGHLCYYVNGMLSMPGGINGFINIFEVDSDTMQYNEAAYIADIEKYGLFTYEEFNAIVPIQREVFNAFNGQYLKVAIGKGIIDLETVSKLLERYSDHLH